MVQWFGTFAELPDLVSQISGPFVLLGVDGSLEFPFQSNEGLGGLSWRFVVRRSEALVLGQFTSLGGLAALSRLDFGLGSSSSTRGRELLAASAARRTRSR